MTPQLVPLPTFQGVGSNANSEVQASTKVPPGIFLRKILIKALVAAGNKTLFEIINDIRINIDGKTQRLVSAAELDTINKRFGPDYALVTSGSIGAGTLASQITIFFLEPWRNDPLSNNGRIYGWNLNGVPGVEVLVNIKTGLNSPQLSGFYEYEPAIAGQGFGPIVKWLRKDASPTATPVDLPDTFSLTQPNRLHSAHLFATSNGMYVTKASMKFGSTLFLDQVDLETQQANLLPYGIDPDPSPTPCFHIEADMSDSLADTLPLKGQVSQNLKLDFSAAPTGNMHIVTQLLGPQE